MNGDWQKTIATGNEKGSSFARALTTAIYKARPLALSKAVWPRDDSLAGTIHPPGQASFPLALDNHTSIDA